MSSSPDGRYLAAIKAPDWSRNPELLVWEVASGTAVIRMRHTGPSNLLREPARFRPDNRAVTTRDVNGVLRLWEVPSGTLLGERPLDGDGVTRFSPDGRVVAAAAALGVRLLDGNTLAPLPGGFLTHPGPVTDVAFSPDGASLLVGYESAPAQVWDVTTRKPVGPPAVLIGSLLAVTFTPDGKTCVCVAADGSVRRWPVPVPLAEPDLARLADRIALTAGQRMDDAQGLDFVPADEWRALRAKLAGDGSTALVGPRPAADRHDARAADAEQDGDASGAEWHLDRLAALRPDDWTSPARRGRVLAAAGRREEADAAYAAARRLAPSPQVLSDWLRVSAATDEAAGRKEPARWNLDRAVALTPGDWALYALRANLVDPARAVADADEAIRLGAEPSTILRVVVRVAESGDWKRSDDWTKPLAWVGHALVRLDAAEKANPGQKDGLRRTRHTFLNTRGAVLYRAGRFEESAKVLREGMSFHPGGAFHDWVFLALAEHRIGHADVAKEAAARARAQAGPKSGTVWDKAEVELLTAELDAALPREKK